METFMEELFANWSTLSFPNSLGIIDFGPPTHPPMHPIPSIKFASSLPSCALESNFLHSTTPLPCIAFKNFSFSGKSLFTTSSTAIETPPVLAYNLPPREAYSDENLLAFLIYLCLENQIYP